MNLFYEVCGNYSKLPDKEIDLFIGDKLVKSKIGRFEALFVIDEENQIKKMECVFLLGLSEENFIPHPAVVYVNLPSNLLKKTDVYHYKMSLTEQSSIDNISEFSSYFKKTNRSPVRRFHFSSPCNDLFLDNEEIIQDDIKREKYIIN